MSIIHILWDESHIWGLLAWRALQTLEIPYKLVRGQEIAQGLFSCKPPSLLLVPGGNARRKAVALGEKGMDAVRGYVQEGGAYLGICGGAGLGLSAGEQNKPYKKGILGEPNEKNAYAKSQMYSAHHSEVLGLCPWQRAQFTERMQHFVSGHVLSDITRGHELSPDEPQKNEHVRTNDNKLEMPLPIWWPGRFAPEEGKGVNVLARYAKPAAENAQSDACGSNYDDFWVADMPLNSLPRGTFDTWEAQYGIALRPSFLSAQPCVISGRSGKGRYVLSYSHLETPHSAPANAWLVKIIEKLSGIQTAKREVPAWNLHEQPVLWHDSALARAREIFDEIIRLGREHSLLFRRNAWLTGWRSGIPGAELNNLISYILTLQSIAPSAEAAKFWDTQKQDFMTHLEEFYAGVQGYLLAERLAMTLTKTIPDALPPQQLRMHRAALFGPPMQQGGLYASLLAILEACAFFQLQNSATD